jgi:hypothetical protein
MGMRTLAASKERTCFREAIVPNSSLAHQQLLADFQFLSLQRWIFTARGNCHDFHGILYSWKSRWGKVAWTRLIRGADKKLIGKMHYTIIIRRVLWLSGFSSIEPRGVFEEYWTEFHWNSMEFRSLKQNVVNLEKEPYACWCDPPNSLPSYQYPANIDPHNAICLCQCLLSMCPTSSLWIQQSFCLSCIWERLWMPYDDVSSSQFDLCSRSLGRHCSL